MSMNGRLTWFRDPRDYQITVLGGLLVYGLTVLGFDLALLQVLVTLAAVLLTQFLCTRLWRLPRFDPKSALISGLSLCLLLRTNHLWLIVVAASAVAAFIGATVLAGGQGELRAFILGFAGGAILTMLSDTLVPEAFENAGDLAGLLTTLGFGLAFGLSLLD